MTANDDVTEAHKYSSNHRELIRKSELCGCFYCLEIFLPDTICQWADSVEGFDTTAICPMCCIDSIIGSASGYPITREFLKKMRRRWFSTSYAGYSFIVSDGKIKSIYWT